jgi:hypothetical protein
MSEYQIIVKMPLEAMDDVEARRKAQVIRDGLTHMSFDVVPENTEYKLQQVYKDRPPKGVSQ